MHMINMDSLNWSMSENKFKISLVDLKGLCEKWVPLPSVHAVFIRYSRWQYST